MAALLTGCALDNRLPAPYTPVPPGSELVLHQDLPIPEGWARVFVQSGAMVPYGELARYRPLCYFEHSELSRPEQPQLIPAGTYAVGVSEARLQQVVALGPLQVAASDGWSQVVELLYLELRSAAAPGVRHLVCGRGFTAPAEAGIPTRPQIQVTLGALAELRPAAAANDAGP